MEDQGRVQPSLAGRQINCTYTAMDAAWIKDVARRLHLTTSEWVRTCTLDPKAAAELLDELEQEED